LPFAGLLLFQKVAHQLSLLSAIWNKSRRLPVSFRRSSIMRSAVGAAFIFGRGRLSTNLPAVPLMNSSLLKF
jgi:hypothetical protein